MTPGRQQLDVGWQACGPAIAATCIAITLATLLAGARLGALPALVVLLSATLFALSRTQWAALEGPALLLRDARSHYAYLGVPARLPARLDYRRSLMPWCRLHLARRGNPTVLVASGPSPSHPSLRCLTMWMIVHGCRRTRIDPRLLDALAAVPEHGPARQPHDASHA